MPNKNYLKGRRKEYEVMKALKAEGYAVVRSAGSHGIWDICAVRKEHVLLLQVKYGCGIDKEELALFGVLPVPEYTKKEIWIFEPGNKTPKIKEV